MKAIMKPIMETIKSAELLRDIPFIDAHGHFGPWSITYIPHAMDYGRVIAEMDRYGCDMVWMSASGPGYNDEPAVKNDHVFDFAAAHPGRIVPYCTLSANDPGGTLPELKRCLAKGPCVGVKMHRYHQAEYSLLDPFMQPVLELLTEQCLLYMNHDLGDRAELEEVLRRYPDLRVMAGHFNPRVNDLAGTHANLLDCTCAASAPESIGHEVRRLGTARSMLVGSDFSLFCLAFGIGMVAYADISDADKRDILGGNALRVLERMSWFDRSMLQCTDGSD